MVTTISGKHMDIGESLQEHVNHRISIGVKRFLNDVTQSKVTFSKKHHLYHVDILIHDSTLGNVRATCECDDVYSAFDSAIVKIEKQLRKHKGRIKAHARKDKDSVEYQTGTKYILNIPYYDDERIEEVHEPVTIAEKATNIEKLSVSEAIMKMNLAHLPALLFINKLNSRLNVVYQRIDGNISWVDPGE